MPYDKQGARLQPDEATEDFLDHSREIRTEPPYVPEVGHTINFKIVYEGPQRQNRPVEGDYPTWRVELLHEGEDTDINHTVWKAPDGWHELTIYDRASDTLIQALQKGLGHLLIYCRFDEIDP